MRRNAPANGFQCGSQADPLKRATMPGMVASTLRYGLVVALTALVGADGCSSPGTPKDTELNKSAGTSQSGAEPAPELPELARDSREEILGQGILRLLESEHLRGLAFDDQVSATAFELYLDRLDGAKLFLLDDHVGQLRLAEQRMDDQMRAGNLKLARQGGALMTERRKVVGALIETLLAKPFDFTVDESLELDSDKRTFAKDEAELADRWRKVLKDSVLQRVQRMDAMAKARAELAKNPDAPKPTGEPIPDTFEGREAKARAELKETFSGRFRRLDEADPLQPAETFINAVASVYDPHTAYLAPADKANFDIQMSGKLEGIGAILQEDDHFIRVREVVPGGASWQQGDLEAGDLILSVAQGDDKAVDVADMPIDNVVKMIRGKKGTVVVLTVKKPDETIKVIRITRDVVVVEASYARGAVLEPAAGQSVPKVGYIFLPSFYGGGGGRLGSARSAGRDVGMLLRKFEQMKMPGVIVDLRSNGGGLLQQARDIVGHFIPDGPVVQTQAGDELEVLEDPDPQVAYSGQVVVLVDRFSASASEIVAAALQDYRRALVVGTAEQTHGKGTVQVVFDLDRFAGEGKPLGVLKFTVQQYFRITGKATQRTGVEPDIVLPDPSGFLESGERFLDHNIPPSQVAAASFTASSVSWAVDALAKASQKRVAGNEVLTKVARRTQALQQRQKDTLSPLMLDKWRAKRDRDEKELEALDPKIADSQARLKLRVIEYAGRPRIANGNRKDTRDRLAEWKKGLARDPWLEEAVFILSDMLNASKAQAANDNAVAPAGGAGGIDVGRGNVAQDRPAIGTQAR